MSIYILLSPFLEEKEMEKIFGKNLLDDPTLWHFIPEMLGRTKNRPFECIGTEKETYTALTLVLKKRSTSEQIPIILKKFKTIDAKN
jgi:hypothetical protein